MYVAGAYRETEKQPIYNLQANMVVVVRIPLNRFDKRPSKVTAQPVYHLILRKCY